MNIYLLYDPATLGTYSREVKICPSEVYTKILSGHIHNKTRSHTTVQQEVADKFYIIFFYIHTMINELQLQTIQMNLKKMTSKRSQTQEFIFYGSII